MKIDYEILFWIIVGIYALNHYLWLIKEVKLKREIERCHRIIERFLNKNNQ